MMLTLKMFTKKLILLILTIGFCQSALGQIEKAELVTFFVNERDRLQESILFAQQNTSLEVLQTSQRERLREAWFLFLNHHENLSLMARDLSQNKYQELTNVSQGELILLRYGIFLAQYRSAIEMINLVEKVQGSDVVLNEAYQPLNIPLGSLAQFKFHYLNIERFAEYSAFRFRTWSKDLGSAEFNQVFQQDLQVVEKFHQGRGTVLTLKNAFKIAQNITTQIFFPVQKGVSAWMGDTKVNRWNQALISPEQLQEVITQVKPGDVLFQRREWYLSNIGLPGFWPHNALYIGRPEERQEIVQDPEVQAWVRSQGVASGNFEDLLQKKYGEIYELSLGQDKENNPYRILEAISEGVVFTSLEYSGAADSMAILRPRLSLLDIAKALYDSFQYQGRPYDFDFDFRTDSAVVCSELIFYAYQNRENKKGLSLPMKSVLGRPIVAPNDIVKEYALARSSGSEEFDFVLFLDGNEKDLKASFESHEEFLKSWTRPKWHILNQMAVPVDSADQLRN